MFYGNADALFNAAAILPPGTVYTSKVYALTATSSAKALTDLHANGVIGCYVTLKASGGTVWFSFGTSSGVTATINTDNNGFLQDGQEKDYWIPIGSAITHLAIIAADTTPKLFVQRSSLPNGALV